MSRFLQRFAEESADLQSGVEYLDSFLGLRARIVEEDLPQHEVRFKSRLNEKVTQEIGFLYMRTAKRAVADRGQNRAAEFVSAAIACTVPTQSCGWSRAQCETRKLPRSREC